jgi:hypothetical protein
MPKVRLARDQNYLNWIISYPCLIPNCGKVNNLKSDGLIAWHHYKGLKGGGMGIKPPDYHAIPLCAEHHNLWHRMGESYFKLDRGYILDQMNKYLIAYIIHIKMEAIKMNPSKSDLKSKQEFPGSAGKGKLPKQESIKPKQEFPGSAGKGSLPKSPAQ